MDQLLSHNLWPTLRKLGKKATHKKAAIAYVTSEDFLTFKDGDELITDGSDGAITSGQTNAGVLERAVKQGAEVYSLGGLHAKAMLLDDVAVIGSANLSTSSATSLIEAAWISTSPTLVAGIGDLIRQLKEVAIRVDERFIRRISQLEVVPRIGRRSAQLASKQVKLKPSRVWLVGVHELLRLNPNEQVEIEKGEIIATKRLHRKGSQADWIRWTGNSRFRREAKEGDSVITIWSEGTPKRITAVYRHAPILLRQDDQRCTRLFIENFADAEKWVLTWSKFKKLLRRVGAVGTIGMYSSREITQEQSEALHQLWKD